MRPAEPKLCSTTVWVGGPRAHETRTKSRDAPTFGAAFRLLQAVCWASFGSERVYNVGSRDCSPHIHRSMATKRTVRKEAAPAPARTRRRAGSPPAAAPEVDLEKQSFFELVDGVSEDDWETHKVYIYRRWPRVQTETPHYLEKVQHPIDEEWLLNAWGSGRYRLRLNSKTKALASVVCEVHDLKRPPRLDPAELVDCTENQRYYSLWPAQKPVGREDQGSADGASTAAVREMGQLARQAQARPLLDQSVADLFLKSAAAREDLVTKMATPGAQADPLDLVDRILGFVERRLVVPPPPPTVAPLSQLGELKDALLALKELQGILPAPTESVSENTWIHVLNSRAVSGAAESLFSSPGMAMLLGRLVTHFTPAEAPPATQQGAAGLAAASLPPAPPMTLDLAFNCVVPLLLAGAERGYDVDGIVAALEITEPVVFDFLKAQGTEAIISSLKQGPNWPQIAAFEAPLRGLLQGIEHAQDEAEEAPQNEQPNPGVPAA